MVKLTPEEIQARSLEAQHWISVADTEKQRLHDRALEFVTPRHQRRDVIRALNATVTMIQNWQTRHQVSLDADSIRDGQEWRLYSTRDVLLLGVAVRLSEVGFKASLLQGVLNKVKPILYVGSPYLSASRASFIVVLASGEVIGPEMGTSLDLATVPQGSFIVVRLDKLIREALEPLGFSITFGNSRDMQETSKRLNAIPVDTDDPGA